MRDSDQEEKNLSFKFMEKAYKFAKENRALGMGVLAYHSYLQSNNIAFESIEASQKNIEIFKLLKEKAYKASEAVAEIIGEPESRKRYGRRDTKRLAPAAKIVGS